METCRLSLLGAEVDKVTPAFVLDFVARACAAGRGAVIANHNLHSLFLHARRADVRAFYTQAALIEFDSTPMIAWARLMGLPVTRAHRSTYLDFRDDFWAMAEARNLGVYHLGGAPGVGEAARRAITARHPRARIDIHDGYFDVHGEDNAVVLADIAAKRPDILLVGMGMPRQELWILDNLARLPPCVILTVGGAFDYEAGVQYLPPRWTGRFGVEWLARFLADPGRLFARYFIEPWSLLPLAASDIALRLSGRGRQVVRAPFADTPAPWQRRQALSSHVAVADSVAPAEAEIEEETAKPHRILMGGEL